jgi:hypothetical protein
MNHHEALAHPAAAHPVPDCAGELIDPTSGCWGDVAWTILTCRACGAEVATVGGRVHWWNHELRPAIDTTTPAPDTYPTCFGEGVDGCADLWLPCTRCQGMGRLDGAALTAG